MTYCIAQGTIQYSVMAYIYARMGKIKNRNCMDLTEVENIKKRRQEYTEVLYKNDLHDPDNSSVITQLKPDFLECKSSGP